MELIDLLVFVVFAAVFLFNTLRGKRRPQVPQPQEQAPGPAAPSELGLESAVGQEAVWGREPVSLEVIPPPVIAAPVPRERERREALAPRPRPPAVVLRQRHPLFRNRQATRDAVVAMTVLGPCRALAPYEDGTGAPAPAPRR